MARGLLFPDRLDSFIWLRTADPVRREARPRGLLLARAVPLPGPRLRLRRRAPLRPHLARARRRRRRRRRRRSEHAGDAAQGHALPSDPARGRPRAYLLLNGGGIPSEWSLYVVCVGPRPAGNKALEYTLEVRGGGSGALSLSATGPVACTRRWAGHHPTEGFLFVPDAYWSSGGGVSVTVHVRKLAIDKAA
ncbi:hypothetical protein ACP4OV_021932 [Aristida adscensionis]